MSYMPGTVFQMICLLALVTGQITGAWTTAILWVWRPGRVRQ